MRSVSSRVLSLVVLCILAIQPAQAATVVKSNTTGGGVDGLGSFIPGFITRTVSYTGADFSAGDLITDVTITVRFEKIDGGFGSSEPFACIPAGGFGHAGGAVFNSEISLLLSSPSSSVVLVEDDLGSYGTGPPTYSTTSYGGVVDVTFDDAAAVQPSGTPATGTFLGRQALAGFVGQSPLGTWTLTLGDTFAADPLCFYRFDLAVTAAGAGAPDLTVTKTDLPDPVVAGTDLTYTVTATNTGTADAPDVEISDPLPPGTTFVSATPSAGGACVTPPVGGTGTVTCTWAGATGIGVSRTLTLVVHIAASVPGGSTIYNLATAVSSVLSVDASADTLVISQPNLVVTKSDLPDPVNAGEDITYSIAATNVGPSDALNLEISDPLPPNTTYVSATPSAGGACVTPTVGGTGTVTCTWAGATGVGVVRSLTLVVNVALTAADGSTITNVATVIPSVLTQDATADTLVINQADLSVTKDDGVTEVTAGGSTTYTITVDNPGGFLGSYTMVDTNDPGGPAVDFEDISATGTAVFLGDDEVSAPIPLGFTFDFFDLPYTAVYISSNGFLSVLPGQTDGCCSGPPLPATFNANGVIAAWWEDLTPPLGAGQIDHQVLGTAPNRRFIIQFTDVEHFPGGNATTHQYKLFEGTDVIEVHYLAAPSDGGQHTAGIENETGTVGNQFFLGTGSFATPVAVRYTPDTFGTDVVGATVADTFPPELACTWTCAPSGGASCTAGPVAGDIADTVDIPAGDSVTYTAACAIDLGASGTLTNTATVTAPAGVTDPDPSNNSSTDVDTVLADADLSITKTDDPDPVVAGSTLTYTVTVDNAGPLDAANVVVTDTLPAGVSFVSTSGCVESPAGGVPTCTLGTIPASGSAMYTITVTVDPSTSGVITNQASVASSTPDPDSGNNSTSEDTTVVAEADLSITKTDSPDPVNAGDNLTYAITATSGGPSDAQNLQIADTLPPNTTFVSATPSAGGACVMPAVGGTGTVTCTWAGATGVGGSRTLTLVVAVAITAADGSTISNTATTSSSTTDPGPSPNAATADTTVINQADLSVTKDDGVSTVVPGTSTTYTITVGNTGGGFLGYGVDDSNDPGGPVFNFEDISATGTAVFLGDEQVSAAIPLGFSFDYFDLPYSAVYISSNGFLRVLAAGSAGCCTGQPIPTPGGSGGDGIIAGWWDDLDPPEGIGQIDHQVLGTAPNRRMIVQFTDVEHFPSGTATTFQFKIFEGSDVIEVQYQSAPSDGSQHSAGIEDETGSNGVQYFLGSGALPTPLAVRYTPVSFGNDVVGATVADTFPPELSCTWTCSPSGGASCTAGPVTGDINDSVDIPSGDSVTYTAVCAIDPSAVGTLSNTATVTPPAGVTDPEPSNNSATDDDALTPVADLAIVKIDDPDPVIAGTGLTYTVTVANAGPSDAAGVMVTDTLPAGVSFVSTSGCNNDTTGVPTCDLGTIPAGGMASYTISTTVDPSTLGLITNGVMVASSATDPDGSDNSVTEDTTVIAEADLSITKIDDPDPVAAGTNLTYTVTVSNAGPSDALNVAVSDTLPAGVSLVSTSGCAEDPTGVPTCTLGTIAAGGMASYTITVAVDPSILGPITNDAGVTSDTPDPYPGNESASAETTVVDEADLSITKTDDPDPVMAGTNLTYTVTVTNAGPSDARDVVVTDTLPAGVVLVSTAGCAEDPAGVPTCSLGTIPAGGMASYTIVVAVDPATLGVITNNASVATSATDPNGANDATSEDTTVIATADLGVTKDDSQDPAAAGDPLSYTVTVTNDGPSDAANVVVTDTLPAGVTFVATSGCLNDPNGVPTCDLGTIPAGGMASYTIDVNVDASTPSGPITNTVSVASDAGDPDPSDDEDSEETLIDADPPTVTLVDSVAGTGDGELAECEEAKVSITRLRVSFSEAVQDPPGDSGASDVTNPANYRLVAAGPDGDFSTDVCGPVLFDDTGVAVDAVTYSAGTLTATLEVNGGTALDDSLYRLLACGSTSIRDVAGNALDGDGDGTRGDDFLRTYRVDVANLFAGGHFDCTIDPWVTVSTLPEEIEHSLDDVQDSLVSGSAEVVNLSASTDFGLGQCLGVAGGASYSLTGRYRLAMPAGGLLFISRSCDFYAGPDCTGGLLLTETDVAFSTGTGGDWEAVASTVVAPAGATSALCGFDLVTPEGDDFDAHLDELDLRLLDGGGGSGSDAIFTDGFESGDASGWAPSRR